MDDELPLDFSRPPEAPQPRARDEEPAPPVQQGLDFTGIGRPARARRAGPDGVDRWRAERRAQQEKLAYDIGLPLGQAVYCDLKDGSSLKGTLRLHEEAWLRSPKASHLHKIMLRIGRATFEASDISSCSTI